MTQPIAPAGPKGVNLTSQADTSSVRDKSAAATMPDSVRSKSGGADSISISVAARRQLAVHSSLHNDRLGTTRPGNANSMTAADKAAQLLGEMRTAFHSKQGEDGFNARLDFNRDGMINVQDMAMLRRKLSEAMGAPPAIIDDSMPVAADGADMMANVPPVEATASNSMSTIDALRASFHTREGDDGFNAAVDFNKDGVIDARDLGLARRGPSEDAQPVTPTLTGAGNDASDQMKQTMTDLRAAFFTREGQEAYNAAVDFNNDGVVNVRDLAMARSGSTPGDVNITQPVAPQATDSVSYGDRARTLVQQLREAFFSSRGDASFRVNLDSNGDGRINVADLAAARDRMRDESS